MANLEVFCFDLDNVFQDYVYGYEDVKIAYNNHQTYRTGSFNYSNNENPFEAHFVDVKVGQGHLPSFSGPELGIAQTVHENISSSHPTYIIKYASD